MSLRWRRRHGRDGRSRRRPDEQPPDDDQGDFEIRAWIRAELLGIPLLTVKSRVLTGQPRAFRRWPQTRRHLEGRQADQGMVQAIALLSRCTHTLDELSTSSKGDRPGRVG
jgi:hypothetical protein